jgi:predicted MPP superfamily phosphohydrolase
VPVAIYNPISQGSNVRILIISDIHANLQALEAALEAAPEHDVVVNLGDVVGYGANPNEVVKVSRGLGKIFAAIMTRLPAALMMQRTSIPSLRPRSNGRVPT